MRALALAIILAAAPAAALAQPATYGSLADPTEASLDPLRRATARLALMGGPSYLGVRWRGVGGAEAEGSIGPFSLSVEGHLRLSPQGVYEPDVDEAYDILRTLRYARIDPTPSVPVYLRFGPIRRMTVESGLLVRDFATIAAWNERTVGAEFAARMLGLEVGAFTADLRPNNLVGGYVAAEPLGALRRSRLSSLRISAHAVHDLALVGEEATTAVGAEARVDLLAFGDLRGGVLAGHARYLNYGHGTVVGLVGGAELFDIGLVQARLGLTQSSQQFIPGYINAFYPVHNPEARIISSDAYFRDSGTQQVVGTALEESAGGTALFFELRAIVFNAFELSQHVRRDYGGETGAFGLRLAVSPDRGRNLRFLFDVQRQGMRGFRDLFSDLVDEAVLTFRADYAAAGAVHVFIRSRYGYRNVGELPDGASRYLVERRFEPMVGIALWR